MSISFRPAREADREWLYAMTRATMKEYIEATWGRWDEAWQRARFDERFNPADVQIIQWNGEDVGKLNVERSIEEIFIRQIELKPERQKHGIGSAVLRLLRDEADAKGNSLRLQVLKVNPVRRLYARLGFSVTAETETHFIMTRTTTRLPRNHASPGSG